MLTVAKDVACCRSLVCNRGSPPRGEAVDRRDSSSGACVVRSLRRGPDSRQPLNPARPRDFTIRGTTDLLGSGFAARPGACDNSRRPARLCVCGCGGMGGRRVNVALVALCVRVRSADVATSGALGAPRGGDPGTAGNGSIWKGGGGGQARPWLRPQAPPLCRNLKPLPEVNETPPRRAGRLSNAVLPTPGIRARRVARSSPRSAIFVSHRSSSF